MYNDHANFKYDGKYKYVRNIMFNNNFYSDIFDKIKDVYYTNLDDIIVNNDINKELIDKYGLVGIEVLNDEELTTKLSEVLNKLLEEDNLTEVVIVMKYLSRLERVFD